MKKLLVCFVIVSLLFPAVLFAQGNTIEKLFSSIRNGEIETFKTIIEKDNSVINATNRSSSTPLNFAASLNQVEICNYLIDNNADVNVANVNGSTAIQFASLNGQLDLVKKLIVKGAKANVWNNLGRNAIHYAAFSGNIELFEFLESKGLDMTPATADGGTMLHWACYGGNIEMVKYLLNRDFSLDSVDKDGNSVLNWASTGNNIEMLKFLVEEKGMDVRVDDHTATNVLQAAAARRNLDGVKYFLSKGYEVDEKFENGESLIHLAGSIGDVDFLKYVLEKGVDVNATNNRGSTALNNAAFAGNVEMIALLMDNGALIAPKICKESACAESPTPLHNAAWRSPNVIQYFINHGVDVNILDNNYKTALHNAMRGDSIRNIKLLCDANININQQDKNGMTALHTGARYGKLEGIKSLLKYNPDVNIADISGRTPLHYAAIKGNNEIINLLLKNIAEINLKDKKGNSSLDLAKYYGNTKSAKVLAANGVKSFKKAKSLFEKDLAIGESAIWYLDHSGYAIKTKNNLLIFDYWERQPLTENGSLNNGYINPEELKDLNVTVFVSHTHGDHFSQVIFDWKDKIKNINYVLGFEHNTEVDYKYIPARETKEVGNVKITPVVSNDSGQGFYVEVDGVTIFHPGDHTNISRDMCPNYTGDIKFLQEKYKQTDIAFYPVTGCRFRDKVALKMGTEFTLKTMKPMLALPMHGSNNEYAYKRVAEEFNKELGIDSFKYPLNRGDRFYFNNSDLSLAKTK
ncbi:MAG: ankyrin repeat domain-containing protein [Bacteroidales bacterium]|jgi:ankyrin repeat protein|nr:ankyrin repeat domain-containing protein [Bacteroidales bacterium]